MQESTHKTLTDKCSCLKSWLPLAAQFFHLSIFELVCVGVCLLALFTSYSCKALFEYNSPFASSEPPPEHTIIAGSSTNANNRTFCEWV